MLVWQTSEADDPVGLLYQFQHIRQAGLLKTRCIAVGGQSTLE